MSRIACACLAATLLAGVPAGVAGAHETRPVGPVGFVVGWANEPAFVGYLNAVQLRVRRGETPVEGLAGAIKVEVLYADGSERIGPLEMRAVFNSPGEYHADLLPTAPGSYTFHFTGTVEGESIDQTFQSGEETFDEVRGTTEVEFPERAPSRSELAQAIEALEPRVDEAADTSSAPAPAVLVYAALALGALALVVSLVRKRG